MTKSMWANSGGPPRTAFAALEIERTHDPDDDAVRRAVAILLGERSEALGGRAA